LQSVKLPADKFTQIISSAVVKDLRSDGKEKNKVLKSENKDLKFKEDKD